MKGSIDLTEAQKYIVSLELQAGKILKKYFVSRNFTHKSKGGVDFTTQADLEVDAFLVRNIRKRYPHTNFLTEETAPSDYSPMRNESNLWIIDPIDGTTNFSRNHPNFAISVGLVDKGIPRLGVVHMPITESTYWAQEDKEGTFLNGELIRVSSTDNLKESVIACDWAWGLEKRLNVVRWLGNICTHVRAIKSMGSAVSDLASLAGGQIDAYMHSGLKPWDTAASSLLIEKAGGRITTPTGAKWNVFQPDMLATNGILHDRILTLVNEK